MRLAAAACWITAGCGYLTLETITAAGFTPHYGYASNMVSDLGRPGVSALAPLMNIAFVLQGTLFLVAAVLVSRAIETTRAWPFLTFAAMNAVGNVVVGTVHSGPGGLQSIHVAGAVLALVGGNAAILAGFPIIDDAGWYCTLSRGLATLGLLAFAVLAVQSITGAVWIVPDPLWERLSAYTIILWQVISAVHLLRTRGVKTTPPC